MGLADRLKGLTKKAEDTAVEHKDQIHQAVEKAEATADQRTGGKYHEQIQKAGAKADNLVDGLQGSETKTVSEGTTDGESTPRAS
ncbi:MAG TPA: antitoxin [Solirubrobacteraceae bacterium]|nr:antitoxin [Solirubrobacteraceae bacterium]